MARLVSVIIPVYNYEQYVADCIRSILNQDYPNFEIIAVNDCSTDKSLDVLKMFGEKITVIDLKCNGGYSHAKNEGIIASHGHYIVPLDADDMLTRNSLSVRVKVAKKHRAQFVHAKAANIKSNVGLTEAYGINFRKARFMRAKIHAQTVLYEKSIHKKFGLYDEGLRSRADKEMWWRLFGNTKGWEFSKVRRKYIDKFVAYYRRHDESMMAMRRKNRAYNERMTKLLNEACEIRSQGITKENTRLLD